MANNAIDALGGALFTLAVASSLGIATVDLAGLTFGDVLMTVAGVDLSLGAVIGVGTLALAWFANEPSWSRFTDEQQLLVGVTLGLVVVGTVTDLSGFLGNSMLLGLGVIGIEAGGYWAIAQAS